MNALTTFALTVLVCMLLSIPANAQTPAAKVGDRIITIEELKKTVNSTPYALPEGKVGSASQKQLIMEVLGNMIDAELLYDEAVAQKIPISPSFLREAALWRRTRLADGYRARLSSTISVDRKEVEAFAKKNGLNAEAAKALLTNERRKNIMETELTRLFDAYKVTYVPTIATASPASFADNDILVSSSQFSVYYRDIKNALTEAGGGKNAMMTLLAQTVEEELMAKAAENSGMASEKEFLEEEAGNNRILTIVLYRAVLEKKFRPTRKEASAFIKKNDWLRFHPQKAEVLLIVAASESEAQSLRQRALKGESFHELAIDHSIVPNAAVSAGRMPPLRIGDGPYSAIDTALLSLKPDGITQPIKGDKGYSLFKLLSITPRELRAPDEMRMQAQQMIMEERMTRHLDGLRKAATIVIYPAVKEM